MRNRSSGAVGKSLYECTAMSTVPSWMASLSAAVNTPTPMSAMGALDRSPAVLMTTSSARCPLAISASRINPACVVARRLPRVPIRITVANRDDVLHAAMLAKAVPGRPAEGAPSEEAP